MPEITKNTRWRCASRAAETPSKSLGIIQFEPTVENYQSHSDIDVRMAMVENDNGCWLHGVNCTMERYEQ